MPNPGSSSDQGYWNVVHPKLKKLGRRQIHNFLKDREQYLLRVHDSEASGHALPTVPLVSSVDHDLLLSLIKFECFPSVTQYSQLTDEILLDYLKSKDEVKLESVSLDDLESAFKASVKINTNEPDAELRIHALFTDYQTLLRNKKWERLIDDNPKLAIRHVCALLKPAALKNKIDQDLSLGFNELRKKWLPFFHHVVKCAIACEEYVPLRQATILEKDHQPNGAGGYSKGQKPGEGAARGKHQKDTNASRSQLPSESCTTGSRSQSGNHLNEKKRHSDAGMLATSWNKPLPDCLHHKCNGKHYVRDCTLATEDEKKNLLQKLRDRRRGEGRMMSRLKAGAEFPTVGLAPDSQIIPPGRYTAKLADTVCAIVNGDYGADHAALSQEHLDSCADAGIFVQVLPLREPLGMHLAMGNSEREVMPTVFAQQKARLSLTLETTHGPLRLRNVEWLVFDEPMPEILLSRPLLQAIGFDLDEHLKVFRDRYHDCDISHIGFSQNQEEGAAGVKGIPRTSETVTEGTRGKLSQLLEAFSPSESDHPTLPIDELPRYQPPHWNTAVAIITPPEPHERNQNIGTTQMVDVGAHNPDELSRYLDDMIDDAISQGLPVANQQPLKDLVHEFEDVFRVRLGSDPPASITAMKVILTPDATPIRVKVRRYAPPQRQFLRNKIDELLSLGLIYENNTSQWASAPLIVPKAGPEKFCFTVDLRPVNLQTVPHLWPMPNLEQVTSELANDVCYASLDLCHGYWQLPLHKDSQECQSFISPDGVFTPTRVMHGQTNAVCYLQSSFQLVTKSIRDSLLQWLDDMLIHCRSPDQLLQVLRTFFLICRKHGFKLHAKKCKLYLEEVKWCGRLISKEGIKLDPRRLQALLDMPEPANGAQLQQFVCAANWMRSAIPNFNGMVAILHRAMECVYDRAPKRSKRAVAQIKLDEDLWGEAERRCFESMKEALANSVTLSHPDHSKLLCLFTDASEEHWAGVLTQIPSSVIDIPFEEQPHEPMAFLSGSFTGSAARWSTAEKEGFAIIESVRKLDYILLRPEGFCLFTDHKNLVFIFNPHMASPPLAKHKVTKIERWAMQLAGFRYTIMHIPGEENCWADLLSRRGSAPVHPEMANITRATLSSLFVAPVAPELDPEFIWPKAGDILDAQRHSLQQDNETAPVRQHRGLHVNEQGLVWIPATAVALQLRICIVAHCGRGGHRGYSTTLQHIEDHFYWANVKGDVEAFCRSCLHCLLTLGGRRIPRPMGHALHSDRPNEVLHFDYLYMGPSATSDVYGLLLKDDASSFVWIEPCKAADAETTADVLLRWMASFGIATNWVSDRGSHFKNKVMSNINRAMHSQHHFTTPYCPQGNGTVETVCKEVLRACRALLSEFRMRELDWPHVYRLVQSMLNHTKRPSLGNVAPITAFTGMPPDNPLLSILPPDIAQPQSLEFIRAQKVMKIDCLVAAVDQVHKKVAKTRTRKRRQSVKAHNAKTHVQEINLDAGDYVLVAQRLMNDGHKLRVKWRGPQRVTRAVSELVFEVEDLITKTHALIHANRLKFYSDSQLDVTETLLDTVAHNNPHYNTVHALLDLRYDKPSD